MSYDLQAAAARPAVIAAVRARLAGSRAVELPHGLAMIPMTVSLSPTGTAVPPFEALGSALADLFESASGAGPVAYFEIDEQLDMTWQAAMVWSAGKVIMPARVVRPGEARPSDGGPVFEAFRRLGAAVEPAGADFDVFGLYRFKHTHQWLG